MPQTDEHYIQCLIDMFLNKAIDLDASNVQIISRGEDFIVRYFAGNAWENRAWPAMRQFNLIFDFLKTFLNMPDIPIGDKFVCAKKVLVYECWILSLVIDIKIKTNSKVISILIVRKERFQRSKERRPQHE